MMRPGHIPSHDLHAEEERRQIELGEALRQPYKFVEFAVLTEEICAACHEPVGTVLSWSDDTWESYEFICHACGELNLWLNDEPETISDYRQESFPTLRTVLESHEQERERVARAMRR